MTPSAVRFLCTTFLLLSILTMMITMTALVTGWSDAKGEKGGTILLTTVCTSLLLNILTARDCIHSYGKGRIISVDKWSITAVIVVIWLQLVVYLLVYGITSSPLNPLHIVHIFYQSAALFLMIAAIVYWKHEGTDNAISPV